MCGFRRAMEVLPAIAVAGISFAASQFLFSNFHGPTLPDIMSALITIVALVLLLRVWKPARIWRFAGESASVLEGAPPSAGVVLRAWGPYIILAVMVFLWGLPQFKNLLNAIPGAVITFAWPGLDGMVHKAAPILAAGKDPSFVGRIRQDQAVDGRKGLALFIANDNLRKGAALNAVELAEIIARKHYSDRL